MRNTCLHHKAPGCPLRRRASSNSTEILKNVQRSRRCESSFCLHADWRWRGKGDFAATGCDITFSGAVFGLRLHVMLGFNRA